MSIISKYVESPCNLLRWGFSNSHTGSDFNESCLMICRTGDWIFVLWHRCACTFHPSAWNSVTSGAWPSMSLFYPEKLLNNTHYFVRIKEIEVIIKVLTWKFIALIGIWEIYRLLKNNLKHFNHYTLKWPNVFHTLITAIH